MNVSAAARFWHLALLIPAFSGVLILLFAFSKAVAIPDLETNFFRDAGAAWSDIFAQLGGHQGATQADTPGIIEDVSEMSSNALLNEEQRSMFVRNNAFLLSCSLLMLGFLLGFSLIEASLNSRDEVWMPLVRNFGLLGILLPMYLIVGFNINYPTDFTADGLVPVVTELGVTAGAGDGDLFSYSDGSYTVWCDALYQSLYAVLVAWIVMSLGSGVLARWAAFTAGILTGIAFPFIASWHWGGGWLIMMDANDFSGAALVHVVAGTAALLTIFAARIGGPIGYDLRQAGMNKPLPGSHISIQQMPLAIVGAGFVVLGVIGVQAGSVLSADAPVVAQVLLNSFLAMAAGSLGAGMLSPLSQVRSPFLFSFVGGVAAWAMLSAGPDLLTFGPSIGFGMMAGLVAASMLMVFDQMGLSDPLGAIAGNLFGGMMGTISIIPFMNLDGSFAQFALIGASMMGAGIFILPLVLVLVLIGAFAGSRPRSVQGPPPIPSAVTPPK